MTIKSDIQYLPMTSEHVEEVCNVVGRSFTKEPMTEALHLSYEQVRSDFAKVVEEIGPKGMSTIAVDTTNGQIVGCCLNKDFTMQPMGDDTDHSDALAVFDLVDELDDQVPELKALEPGHMFHVYILAVDSDYGKLDIGLNLVQKAEELARADNFKQMLAEVTGPISQHIFRDNCGFEEIGRVNYKDFEYHGAHVFECIKSVEACLLVQKDL
jgi:ribosomal protein S18 acetylase RimI-like enzyme